MTRPSWNQGVPALLRGWPVLMAAVGCSLITDLDFVGGSAAGAAGQGGNGATDPAGGSSWVSGGFAGADDGGAPAGGRNGGSAGSTGGSEVTGGSAGSETAGIGGVGAGGRGGNGGVSGDEPGGMDAGGEAGAGEGGVGGKGGTGGTAGGGSGGSGGTGGSAAGSGGAAGRGGVGGGGAGGVGGTGGSSGNGGCAGANLTSDPKNCGQCGNPCDDGQICEGSQCVISACAGICAPREIIVKNSANEYRKESIGTGARCYEVRGYVPDLGSDPRIVCWNFAAGRTLSVNDMSLPCTTGMGAVLPTKPDGAYCIEIGMGNNADAGFVMPPH